MNNRMIKKMFTYKFHISNICIYDKELSYIYIYDTKYKELNHEIIDCNEIQIKIQLHNCIQIMDY